MEFDNKIKKYINWHMKISSNDMCTRPVQNSDGAGDPAQELENF